MMIWMVLRLAIHRERAPLPVDLPKKLGFEKGVKITVCFERNWTTGRLDNLLMTRVLDHKPHILPLGKLETSNHVTGAGDVNRVTNIVAQFAGLLCGSERITCRVLKIRDDEVDRLKNAV